ncbi:MAG: hypothetical protein RR460_00040 [Clostridium sp.]
MKLFKLIYDKICSHWCKIHLSTKFIFILCIMCLISLNVSIFVGNVDTVNNMMTIRSAFASIIGYILEDSSKKILTCGDNFLLIRNFTVGIIAISILFTLILCICYDINNNTPSLVLLRSTLFSCIGFLISSSKDCN